MVCLMIGQSGCTGIFDSTKSEVRIAKKVLKEKYNEAKIIFSIVMGFIGITGIQM